MGELDTFNAASIRSSEKARGLIKQGNKPLPLQWIELDKNESNRTAEHQDLEPNFKSRLVGRGDLDTRDVRSDSPTCDLEGHNMVFVFAASKGLTVNSVTSETHVFKAKR